MGLKGKTVESDRLASNATAATCQLCDHGYTDFSEADLLSR